MFALCIVELKIIPQSGELWVVSIILRTFSLVMAPVATQAAEKAAS